MLRLEEACGLYCRAKDRIHPVVVEKCVWTLGVGDEDNFYRPLRWGEARCGLAGLFMCGDKPHVPHRDPDEG